MVYLKNEGKNLPSPRFGTAVSAVTKKNTMLGPLTGSRWVAKENQRTVPAATRPFSGTPSCNRR